MQSWTETCTPLFRMRRVFENEQLTLFKIEGALTPQNAEVWEEEFTLIMQRIDHSIIFDCASLNTTSHELTDILKNLMTGQHVLFESSNTSQEYVAIRGVGFEGVGLRREMCWLWTGHSEARRKITVTSWENAKAKEKGPQNTEESMTFILVIGMLITGMIIGRPSFLHNSSIPLDHFGYQMGAAIHDGHDLSAADDPGRSAFDLSFATKEIGVYQDGNAMYAVGKFPLELEEGHGKLVVPKTIGSPEINRIQPILEPINPNKLSERGM